VTVEASTHGGSRLARARIAELTEREMAKLAERTPGSRQRFERGRDVMPGGVPSSFQENDPWPVYLDRGEGARVWDVDGHEYVDFHNGFGVMCIGHANPRVGAAVKQRIDLGTHFAAPTDGSIAVAEELADRFGLPQWRFTNSGTESTMDAVHLARGATGRDVVLKIEGSYHGHHDAVMVSVYPELEALGERDDPRSVPYGEGYPRALTELTRAVPFNDAGALERVLAKLEGRVAGLIMEPAMMNINIIPPVEGYLERVRELTREHGVKLIFDEVKTGATIARGGATRRFGVEPDMITLAKAICGGYPGGAIGMSAEISELISSGRVHQYGTFNGNPLVMAAAEATLTAVLTDDAYAKLEESNRWLLRACDEIIRRYELPCYTEGLGAKGCVVFSPEPLREYRDYLTRVDGDLSTLAWLYHMNNGVFMTPGVEEEWTLSVAHSTDDLQRFVDAFEAFARDVSESSASA
jgi:glutamate-1-semialdehyde 2,1-aminomutase